MNELLSKSELISALQSGALGIAVGAFFAIFGLKPPSPDNLIGIMGVVGIFIGWIVGSYFLK